VRDVRELNTEQIRSLDRAKTAVILVGGILEEHGPYLPSYSDGYWDERIARDLAEAIVARGFNGARLPHAPARAGRRQHHRRQALLPGSFNVRTSTLRAVYMDLADSLGEQGFRWVFIVDGHGSPNHNGALDAAGDYFHDSFGGRMLHLYGLWALRDCCEAEVDRGLGEAGRKEDGFSVHAGAVETAGIVFLRPDLVDPAVRNATALTGSAFSDLVRMARQDGWPGYFGSPRLGSAALGGAIYRAESAAAQRLALRVLDGWDPSAEKRYADVMGADADVAGVNSGSDADAARRERRQAEWPREAAGRRAQ
jgi:creatinine amidohydrolase/Fe(II)-dependent formamide hydrolase-like protein